MLVWILFPSLAAISFFLSLALYHRVVANVFPRQYLRHVLRLLRVSFVPRIFLVGSSFVSSSVVFSIMSCVVFVTYFFGGLSVRIEPTESEGEGHVAHDGGDGIEDDLSCVVRSFPLWHRFPRFPRIVSLASHARFGSVVPASFHVRGISCTSSTCPSLLGRCACRVLVCIVFLLPHLLGEVSSHHGTVGFSAISTAPVRGSAPKPRHAHPTLTLSFTPSPCRYLKVGPSGVGGCGTRFVSHFPPGWDPWTRSNREGHRLREMERERDTHTHTQRD